MQQIQTSSSRAYLRETFEEVWQRKKIFKFQQKTNQSSAQKPYSKAEALNYVYGERAGTYCEYGFAESYNTDNFIAKLIFYKVKMENTDSMILRLV